MVPPNYDMECPGPYMHIMKYAPLFDKAFCLPNLRVVVMAGEGGVGWIFGVGCHSLAWVDEDSVF